MNWEWSITAFFFSRVHDIGAPHGIADEAEETERQANYDSC